MARGIAPESAEMLASEFPAELIHCQLATFDALAAKRDRRVAKNPPGFLVSSIRRGFQWAVAETPKRYRSPKPAPAPVSPPDESVDPVTFAIRERLAAMPAEEQGRREVEALAAANKVTADSYRRLQTKGGPLLKSLRDQLLITHLRKIDESLAIAL